MDISLQEILTQALGFIVLVWVMRIFFWKPLLASLDTRKNRIRNDLEQIESAKRDVDALRDGYQIRLKNIEEESRVKLQEAIEEGRRISREIQDQARAEAQATFEKSRENLTLEVEKAKITLRREVAALALRVAEKVVEEKMTDDAQQAKALRLVDEIEKNL